MTTFVPGREYDARQVSHELGANREQDGVFVGEGAILVFVTPGTAGAGFPRRAMLRWRGALPQTLVDARMRALIFVGREDGLVRFVGQGRLTGYSSGSGGLCDVGFTFAPPLPRAQWLELNEGHLPPAEPAPETALAALLPSSSPEENWAALALFIERWYGKAIGREAGASGSAGVPLSLRRLLAAHALVPGLFQHNHLVEPQELTVEDGRTIFLWENQNVCLWATEREGADPRVWYRNNEEDAPWIEEDASLSVFLIQAVVFEATMNPRFGAHAFALPSTELSPLLARLDPLGNPAWNWGGARFYGRDGALLMTMEHGGGADAFLAAHTPFALSPFEGLVSDAWEDVAF